MTSLNYTVRLGTVDDAIAADTILKEVVVNTTKPELGQQRDIRRLRNNILLGIQEELLVVLLHGTDVVGVQLLHRSNIKTPLILHSNILKEHRNSRGTVLLLNMVVNQVFQGQDVYVLHPPKELHGMLEHVKQDLWKLKSSIGKTAKRYLRRVHG